MDSGEFLYVHGVGVPHHLCSIRPMLSPYLMARMIGPGAENTRQKRRITSRVGLCSISTRTWAYLRFYSVQYAIYAKSPGGCSPSGLDIF